MRHIIPPYARLIPPEAKRVFEGEIFDVYHWPIQLPDGTIQTFEMLKRPDTVKVLAIVDDLLIIIRERPVEGGDFFNLPGGRHDRDSETELDAAKREVAEETGYSFQNWKLLDVAQGHPKIDYFLYTFLATNPLKRSTAHLDSVERIDLQLLTLDQTKALAESPRSRYLARDIIQKTATIQDLIDRPEYAPVRDPKTVIGPSS